ncbi:hypothetical protein [Bradyrhizobium sp. AUGA SZCCT0431]|uniref:hypothetical protein n=1 Tax=Bradyrhizobium sp. AUGA SZCCT0431 TaxID=2807674 RepID=UPI001BAD0D98|nr:hypothetical protein [Bradyrhizobium sp. AUGA SZCCT0431]MBR1148521.1 hypothetical protein [Bradyrhizobium sp. AUGA SZCCT0431]
MTRDSTTGLEDRDRQRILSSPVAYAFVRIVTQRRAFPRPRPSKSISITSTERRRRTIAGVVRTLDHLKRFRIQDGRPCKDIRWPADPVLVPFGGAANGDFRQRSNFYWPGCPGRLQIFELA